MPILSVIDSLCISQVILGQYFFKNLWANAGGVIHAKIRTSRTLGQECLGKVKTTYNACLFDPKDVKLGGVIQGYSIKSIQ